MPAIPTPAVPPMPDSGKGPSAPALVSRAFRAGRRRASSALRRLRLWPTIALGGVVGYCLVLGEVAFRKYQTFNATFADLGLESQVQWLLLHGGISGYYASGFAQIYPIQFQKPIIFLFLPIFALYPHPVTLILAGTLALGFAAIPLYYFAERFLREGWQAAAIALSYLLFFPVASANLFDFHWEDFVPLFFFTMAWAWSAGRRRTMVVAAALTATVNPLALVLSISFLISSCFPPPRAVAARRWVREGIATFLRDRLRLAACLSLAVVLAAYRATGVLYTAGVAVSAGSGGVAGVLFYSVNDKLMLIVLLLAPLAFLPLYSGRGLLLSVPYLAFVFDSTDSANYIPFGLFYTLLGAAPFLVATVDGAAAFGRESPSDAVAAPIDAGHATARARRPPARRDVIQLLVAMSLVFGFVFFPVSPGNTYVAGGYFAGNHSLAVITTDTPATEFLTRVIALIPPSASVLTQNNIPQLAGRTHVEFQPPYFDVAEFDTILLDSSLTYFASPSALVPYANAALSNGSFGVVAEGQGALLLREGYRGPPLLFDPVSANYTSLQLTAFSGIGTKVGSSIVGSGPGYSLWYGPFITLPPGNYTANFVLESNETTTGTSPVLYLQATAASGSRVLASLPISAENFSTPDTPSHFTVGFSLANVTSSVELRGMFPSGQATLTLLGIELMQTTA